MKILVKNDKQLRFYMKYLRFNLFHILTLPNYEFLFLFAFPLNKVTFVLVEWIIVILLIACLWVLNSKENSQIIVNNNNNNKSTKINKKKQNFYNT